MRFICTLILTLSAFGLGTVYQKPMPPPPKPLSIEQPVKIYQPFKHTPLFNRQAQYLSGAIPARALRDSHN